MSDWPHAPLHRLGESGTYFITAGTLYKQHYFRSPAALDYLRDSLFSHAKDHDCRLQAWALFSNHYHLVVASDTGEDVHQMLRQFHVNTAIGVNRHDGVKGRKIWFQHRDTQLTVESSWLARLRYTHENAVHHGLVRDATQYRWCSASWFASNARPAFVETVRRMKIDRINVYDDYAALEGD